MAAAFKLGRRAQQAQKVGAGPRNAGTDRTGWAITNLSRLCIGKAHHLREHESCLAVAIKLGYQVRYSNVAARVGDYNFLGACRNCLLTPPARARPDLVSAGMTGDGKQPRPGRRVAPEVRQAFYGASEHLLAEVIGFLPAYEAGTEPPHFLIASFDKPTEGPGITGSGLER